MALVVMLVGVGVLALASKGGTDLRVTTVLCLATLLALAYALHRNPPKLADLGPGRRVVVWTGVYLLVTALSLLWSVHPHATLLGLMNLLLMTSFFGLAAVAQTAEDLSRLWGGMTLVGVVACAWGLVTYLVTPGGHFPVFRISGTLAYANVFAAFAGVVFIFLITWTGSLPWSRAPWPNWVRVAGLAITAAAFIGAVSRGAGLALLPALAVVWVSSSPSERRLQLKRLAFAALTGLVLFSGMVALKPAVTGESLSLQRLLGGWYERFYPSPPTDGAQVQPGDTSAGPPAVDGVEQSPGAAPGQFLDELSAGPGGRISFWTSALAIAADYPLTGTGLGTFPRMHLTYQHHPRYYATEAHSAYLQVLAETGAVGLLAWLAVIASGLMALVAAGRAARQRSATVEERSHRGSTPRAGADANDLSGQLTALKGALILVLLHSSVDLDMNVPIIQALFWLALGTAGSLALVGAGPGRVPTPRVATRRSRPVRSERDAPRITPLIGAIVILALLLPLPSLSLSLMTSGYQSIVDGRWERGLSRLDAAARLSPWDPTPHLIKSSVLQHVATQGGTGLTDGRVGEIAAGELGAAIHLDPRNPNLWSRQAHLLSLTGDRAGAIEAMARAAELARYIPDYHYQLAVLYAEAGRDQEALDTLRAMLGWWEALMLNPFAREDGAHLEDDIHLLAAEAAYRTGDHEAAKSHLDRVLALDSENARALELMEELRSLTGNG